MCWGRYLCVIYAIDYFYLFNGGNENKYICVHLTFCVTVRKENDLQMRVRAVLPSCASENLKSYMLETQESIETELENLVSGVSDVELRPLLEYALLSKGKRLRPILALLGAQSVGGNPKKVMRLALSFELLHTATLVHDDIIDRDTSRRGTEALCSKWSADGAILAGDALIALSVNLSADFGPRIVKTLADVGLELCDGEYVDASLSLESASEGEYFGKIGKKSASLFRGAAFCGGLVGGGSFGEVEALRGFGECFGMAYQLNDDLEDSLSVGGVSRDLRSGSVTLPFLYAYSRADGASRMLLRNCFGSRKVSVVAAHEVDDILEKTGALRYCRMKIADYKAKSRAHLLGLRDSVYKEYLAHLYDCVGF
jgi:geranylgeranyl diphosphate synthase type I